jgi:hypothetical protein
VEIEVFLLRERQKAKHKRKHCDTQQKRIYEQWRDEKPGEWRK